MSTHSGNIKEIFGEALEKESIDERNTYLDGVCGEDAALRSQVEALLKAHSKDTHFLETLAFATGDTLDDALITEPFKIKIHRYRLLELIGEGGFGVVYRAEQDELAPRQVALKIIKLGMDTKEVIARFEVERQALALMDHPCIAKVIDAGATEMGRPYFVMELVEGVPITDYCDDHRLTTHQRLELLLDVCRAVQHAHQKGIVHRDIKPNNVMVTVFDGKPVPKVIDFGIAKATEHRLTEKTLFTSDGQFLGTPQYISPEQADMSDQDVDPRTDIYSLGVLLYELLTGTTPLDAEHLRKAGYHKICRLICETDAAKPSKRVGVLGSAATEIAARRDVRPAVLKKLLQGDLDVIVTKALEKDPADRYATVGELADDVRRFLEHRTIRANPPTWSHRAAKWACRHCEIVGAVLAVLLVAAVGLAVSTAMIAQQRQAALTAADRADVEAQRAETGFRQARNAVDRMLTRAAEELDDVPHAQQVRRELLQDALEFYQGFLREKEGHSEIRYETALACLRVAEIQTAMGHRDEAAQASRQAIGLLKQLASEFPSEPRYRLSLADSYSSLSETTFWTEHSEEDLQSRRQRLLILQQLAVDFPAEPAYQNLAAGAETHLACGLSALGRKQEALAQHRAAAATWKKLREDFPEVPLDRQGWAHSHLWLGAALVATNHLTEAEQVFDQVLTIRKQFLREDPTSPDRRHKMVRLRMWIGILRQKQGKFDESAQQIRQAIQINEQLVEEFPYRTEYRRRLAAVYYALSNALELLGRAEQSEQALRQSIFHQKKLLKADPGVFQFQLDLARKRYDLGVRLVAQNAQKVAAVKEFQRAQGVWQQCVNEHADDHRAKKHLAAFLVNCPAPQFRDGPRAAELIREVLQHAPQDFQAWVTQGAAHYRAGRWAAAVTTLEHANQSTQGDDVRGWFYLAMSHRQLGHAQDARVWYDRALEKLARKQKRGDVYRWQECERLRGETAALLEVAEQPEDSTDNQ